MFANIGNLIKKLISLFIVGADNTIKAIKELYCVGADGKIHKISTESVKPWLAKVTSTSGSLGYYQVDKNSVGVYKEANSSTAYQLSLNVYRPEGYVAPSNNSLVEADIYVYNSNTTASGYSRVTFRSVSFANKTQASYDLHINQNVALYMNGGSNYFSLTVYCGSVANKNDGMGSIYMENVKIDGIPVEFIDK